MGRELQKKKNRSSIPKHTKRRNPRIHKIKKFGNQIIAQNWNKNETLSQNYKRLGLAVKLNRATGGVEKSLSSSSNTENEVLAVGSFAPTVSTSTIPTTSTTPSSLTLAPGEARIERDSTGKITNVVYGSVGESRLDALDDTISTTTRLNNTVGGLTSLTSTTTQEPTTDVVRALLEQANRGVSIKRSQSEREIDWVERLVEKYGDNYAKMARDKKLNPWQQSEGDIKKRVVKWRQMKAKEEKAKAKAKA